MKDDDEFAFPHQDAAYLGDFYHGMTMRDYYAAKAMQALLTAAWTNPSVASTRYHEWVSDQAPDTPTAFCDWIAHVANEQATAMLRVVKTPCPTRTPHQKLHRKSPAANGG